MANEPAILPSSLVEMMARQDAGESRSDLLMEFELGEASFLEAQRRWLAMIGAAVLRGDFKLQRHYATEYSVHLERARERIASSQAPATPMRISSDEGSSEPPLFVSGAPMSIQQNEPPTAPLSEPRLAEPPLASPSEHLGPAKSSLDVLDEPPLLEPPMVVSPPVVPPTTPAMVMPPPVVPPAAPAMVMSPPAIKPREVIEPPLFKTPQSPSFEAGVVSPSLSRSSVGPAEPPVATPQAGGYQRVPAGFGETVSFSDTGFGIAPVMGAGDRASPAGVLAPPLDRALAEPERAVGSVHEEPQFVPGIAASSGQLRPRPPSLKPLPQQLNFMTAGSVPSASNPANGIPGTKPGSPSPFAGSPPAFAGFPAPGAVSPLPPTGLSPFSAAVPTSHVGGDFPRPAAFGAAQPMSGNWGSPGDFQSPVRGGLPPVPSQSSPVNHAAVVATATNPLSMEQLACIQAELDVDPERFWDLLQANGVNEPSYHAQSAALHQEMVSNPEKARRFEQLREYYRAIFNSPK